MIGNNSCGVHAILAGKTVDNVETLRDSDVRRFALTVGPTTPNSWKQIIRTGRTRRRNLCALKSIRDRYTDLIRSRFPKSPPGFRL